MTKRNFIKGMIIIPTHINLQNSLNIQKDPLRPKGTLHTKYKFLHKSTKTIILGSDLQIHKSQIYIQLFIGFLNT